MQGMPPPYSSGPPPAAPYPQPGYPQPAAGYAQPGYAPAPAVFQPQQSTNTVSIAIHAHICISESLIADLNL